MNALLQVSDNYYLTISQDAKAQEGEDITIRIEMPEELGAYRVRFDYANGRARNMEYLNGRTEVTLKGDYTMRGFLSMQFVLDLTNGTQRKTNVVWVHVAGSIYGVTPDNIVLQELERLAFVEVKQEVDTADLVFYSLSGDEVGRVTIQGDADIAEIHRQIQELAQGLAVATGDISDLQELAGQIQEGLQEFEEQTQADLIRIEGIANQGVTAAQTAQSTAEQAQITADNATAAAAGARSIADSAYELAQDADTAAASVNTALVEHKASGDHDDRYYTQEQVDNKLTEFEYGQEWKHPVATFADLATTYPTPEIGWTAIVLDEGVAYTWNGEEWAQGSAQIPIVTEDNDGLMTSAMLAELQTATETSVNNDTRITDTEASITTLQTDVAENTASIATIESRQDTVDMTLQAHTQSINNITEWSTGAQDEIAQNTQDIATKAPINHASTETTYGPGTDTQYGHVQLMDIISDAMPNDVTMGTATTPKAVLEYGQGILTEAKEYTDEQTGEAGAQPGLFFEIAGTLAVNLTATIGRARMELGEIYNVTVSGATMNAWGAGGQLWFGQIGQYSSANIEAKLWRIVNGILYTKTIVWSYASQAPTQIIDTNSIYVAQRNTFVVPDETTTSWGTKPANNTWNFMYLTEPVIELYNANAGTDIPVFQYSGYVVQTGTYHWNAELWALNLDGGTQEPVHLWLHWAQTSGTAVPAYPNDIKWDRLGGSGPDDNKTRTVYLSTSGSPAQYTYREGGPQGTLTEIKVEEFVYIQSMATVIQALRTAGLVPSYFSDLLMRGLAYRQSETTLYMQLYNTAGDELQIIITGNTIATNTTVLHAYNMANEIDSVKNKIVDLTKTTPEQTVTYETNGTLLRISAGEYVYRTYDGQHGSIVIEQQDVAYTSGNFIAFNPDNGAFAVFAGQDAAMTGPWYLCGEMYYVGTIQATYLHGFGEIRNVPATYQRGLAYMVSAPSTFAISGTTQARFTITGGLCRFMESDTSSIVSQTFNGDYDYIFGDVLFYSPTDGIGVTDPSAMPLACHVIGTMLTVGGTPTISLYGAGTFKYDGTNWVTG